MRLDFLIEIDANPKPIANAMKKVLRDVERELGLEYGFKGLGIKTIEELEQMALGITGKEQFEKFKEYIDYRKQEVDLLETVTANLREQKQLTFDLIEHRKAALEKQRHLGEITIDKFNKEMLDVLRWQLRVEKDIFEKMQDGTTALDVQLGQRQRIYDLQMEIYDFELEMAEFSRRKSEHEQNRLDYLKDIGKLTEEEHKEQSLKLLEDQLDIEKQLLDDLIEQEANALDIFDQRERTWEVEQQIHDLMNAENDLQDEQLNKIRELNRERTKMIFAKGAGEDVDIQDIANIESQIIQEMQNAGATQEQIDAQLQTFRATFPQFQGGTKGMRTNEGPAYLHEGEAVLNPEATNYLDQMFPGFIDDINTFAGDEALKSVASTLARSQAELEVAKTINMINNNNVSLGGVIVYTQTNAKPEDIAAAVDQQIERKFQGQGIQLTQL